MKAVRYMDDALVIQKGINILMKGLGPLEALRFLSLPREARVDSVKRHREWQKHLNKKQFFDDVFTA
jgi:hypothetical protein